MPVKETKNHSYYIRYEASKKTEDFDFSKTKKEFLDNIRDALDALNPNDFENFNVSLTANNYPSGDDNTVF